jgi:Tfp pilus assembly protein PilX
MNIPRKTGHRLQTGSTLTISMIMLVLLTLFVLSAINSGLINLRIAGNTQAQDEARAAAQQAIESVVSSYANFYPTPVAAVTTNISINNDSSGNYSVTRTVPVCKSARQQIPARMISCVNGFRAPLYCWDTLWEVSATATNTKTGVSQSVTQGVKIVFPPQFDPASC